MSAAVSVVAVGAGAFAIATPAAQAAAQPHWTILATSAPTYFKPGDEGDFYEITAVNDGGAPTDGSAITVTDSLPAGVTATAAQGDVGTGSNNGNGSAAMNCPTFEACETTIAVLVGELVRLKITVDVSPAAAGVLHGSVTIAGGGAEPAVAPETTPVSSAPVPFGASFKTNVIGGSGSGSEAGSHPLGLTTILALNVSSVNKVEQCKTLGDQTPGCPNNDTNVKDVEVPLPPGLVGNPTVVPQCPQVVFQTFSSDPCPADSQVGVIRLGFYGGNSAMQAAAVYNVEPPPGQPAELGFIVFREYHIPIFFHLRSDGDYALVAKVSAISEANPLLFSVLSIWGTPAASIHDAWRLGEGTVCGPPAGCSSHLQPRPFLTLPTSCTGSPLPLSLSGDSWQEPLAAPFPLLDSGTLPAIEGCNALRFEPELEARPTTDVADSPSGLHVDLRVPQDTSGPGGGENPEGRATAHLREAVVTLPKGLTVNPSSANGLEGCSPAQIGLRTEEGATPIHFSDQPAQCPDAAKLGTVEVDTPLLKEHNEAGEATSPHPLPGAVYLAKPYDNPFKSLLALYITVNDPKTGIVIKLPAQVHIAPDGRLTTTVQENPQLPFEDFKLDFFGGARAPLRTPATCGSYETTSVLTPWSAPESGEAAKPSDPYEISSGPNGHPCANTEGQEPNKPGFEAGTEKPLAGAYSPFNLHLHREDGTQVFSALNVTLPPGLIGKLAGVAQCSDATLAAAAQKSGAAEQASPSCPTASKIGSVNVGAGAGPAPYYTQGTAYLASPYKGAPLSVAIVTPALAGPFDLGTVVVRNALQVNPETAQISVKSDPIPTQLQGIQLDIRSIEVKLDRNQFTLNPTSCERSAVTGEEISSLGNAAQLTNPFQVGECGKLKFKPKLAISLKGGTRRNKNPALKAALTYPKGDYANIARAQVTLPHSEFLDQSHIQTVCTRVQFAAGNGNGAGCPAASIYGHARAITPLLDNPVEGPVYLRSSSHKLPDLVAALGGQISVDLAGKVDTGKGGGIRNTFEVVPDAPVSKFVLSMKGGSKGLLVNSENICKKPQKALAHFVAQNGKVSDTTPLIANSCKTKHKRHGGHH